MTGSLLTVELDAKLAGEGIARLQKLMANPTPIMRAIGVKLVSTTQDRLGGTKDPDGKPWKPLLPDYFTIKTQPGMLKESGMQGGLQGSITFEATPNSVTIGSNKIYAAVHQFGAVIFPVHAKFLVFRLGSGIQFRKYVVVPERPYLGISTEDKSIIYRVLDGAIERAIFGRAV